MLNCKSNFTEIVALIGDYLKTFEGETLLVRVDGENVLSSTKLDDIAELFTLNSLQGLTSTITLVIDKPCLVAQSWIVRDNKNIVCCLITPNKQVVNTFIMGIAK